MDPSFIIQHNTPRSKPPPLAIALTGALAALFIAIVVLQTSPTGLLHSAMAGPDGLEYVTGAVFALAINIISLLMLFGIWMLKRFPLYGYATLTALQVVLLAIAALEPVVVATYLACRVPVLVAAAVYFRRFT